MTMASLMSLEPDGKMTQGNERKHDDLTIVQTINGIGLNKINLLKNLCLVRVFGITLPFSNDIYWHNRFVCLSFFNI